MIVAIKKTGTLLIGIEIYSNLKVALREENIKDISYGTAARKIREEMEMEYRINSSEILTLYKRQVKR